MARIEPGVADGLLHGDVIPGGAAPQETHRPPVDRLIRDQRGRAVHLAAKAKLRIFVGPRDSGLGLAQAGQDLLRVVAYG